MPHHQFLRTSSTQAYLFKIGTSHFTFLHTFLVLAFLRLLIFLHLVGYKMQGTIYAVLVLVGSVNCLALLELTATVAVNASSVNELAG